MSTIEVILLYQILCQKQREVPNFRKLMSKCSHPANIYEA